MKRFSVPLVLASGCLWGSMGLFVRFFSAQGLQSLDITQMRITTALIAVGMYLLLFHRQGFRVRLKDLWCFWGTGVVSLLMFSICYYQAMRYVTLSVAGVLLYTSPLFVMILSALLFHERITWMKLLALTLAFGGCVCVSGIGSAQQVPPAGLLMGLGAGFFYALYSIFGKLAFARGYDSWTLLFYTFLFCASASAPFAGWSRIFDTAVRIPSFIPWMLAMGISTGFLAYLLYSLGLENMESGKAAILASCEPLVATLIGVFAFHEPMTLSGIAGILLILGAVLLLNLHLPQPRRRAKP